MIFGAQGDLIGVIFRDATKLDQNEVQHDDK